MEKLTLADIEPLEDYLAHREAVQKEMIGLRSRRRVQLGDRISLGFKAPRDSWEIEIDKKTGAATARQETFNTIALLNNLHRGRYSGPAWSWVIDASAVLILLACVTGVILWLGLPRRRRLGIAATLLGAAATLLVFALLVPGPDAPPETPQGEVGRAR